VKLTVQERDNRCGLQSLAMGIEARYDGTIPKVITIGFTTDQGKGIVAVSFGDGTGNDAMTENLHRRLLSRRKLDDTVGKRPANIAPDLYD
jgi:hypothetical protein